jgi:hypothetical protein
MWLKVHTRSVRVPLAKYVKKTLMGEVAHEVATLLKLFIYVSSK